MFYVYEWYVKETNEIFYVGKGSQSRYKDKSRRNKFFMFYLDHFNCESRIIKYFDNEDDAFNYEYQRIVELKKQGLAKANIDLGGNGGTIIWWTKEKRENFKVNNPMKNEISKQKSIQKRKKEIIINGMLYNSIKEASIILKTKPITIIQWCKRGYDNKGKPCRYTNEKQKEIPLIKKLHPKAGFYKAVIIDGIRFETIKDGAKYIGVCHESIIRAIKRDGKCKGHTCKYDNQQPSQTKSDK